MCTILHHKHRVHQINTTEISQTFNPTTHGPIMKQPSANRLETEYASKRICISRLSWRRSHRFRLLLSWRTRRTCRGGIAR